MLLILLCFYTKKRNKRERGVILGVLLFFSVQIAALGWSWRGLVVSGWLGLC
jgi:hypothetical protein